VCETKGEEIRYKMTSVREIVTKNKRTKINKETMKKNESKIQFTIGWSVNYVTTPNQLQIIRVKENGPMVRLRTVQLRYSKSLRKMQLRSTSNLVPNKIQTPRLTVY
jgi:hypothetical protein